jgi:hypothetical protein
MNPTIFFKLVSFQSRQFDWHDSWSNHVVFTNAIRRGGACPVVDVAACSPQPRQSGWCDWVALSAVARLTVQPPHAMCPLVTLEQAARLALTWTDARLLPSLSSLFILSLPAQAIRVASIFTGAGCPPPTPVLPEVKSSSSPKIALPF